MNLTLIVQYHVTVRQTKLLVRHLTARATLTSMLQCNISRRRKCHSEQKKRNKPPMSVASEVTCVQTEKWGQKCCFHPSGLGGHSLTHTPDFQRSSTDYRTISASSRGYARPVYTLDTHIVAGQST